MKERGRDQCWLIDGSKEAGLRDIDSEVGLVPFGPWVLHILSFRVRRGMSMGGG